MVQRKSWLTNGLTRRIVMLQSRVERTELEKLVQGARRRLYIVSTSTIQGL